MQSAKSVQSAIGALHSVQCAVCVVVPYAVFNCALRTVQLRGRGHCAVIGVHGDQLTFPSPNSITMLRLRVRGECQACMHIPQRDPCMLLGGKIWATHSFRLSQKRVLQIPPKKHC